MYKAREIWNSTHFFNKGQLIDIPNNEVEEEEVVQDAELNKIDVAIWEK